MNPDPEDTRSGSAHRVGLFGGTFDPPTIAHLVAADWVRQAYPLDCIWFVPANQNPLKNHRATTPPEVRLEMISTAISGITAFRLETVEIERGGTSYTIETLQQLQNHHPEIAFHLILGQDGFLQMKDWKEVEAIFKRVPVIVMTRPEVDTSSVPKRIVDQVNMLEIPDMAISSTLVRELVGKGWDIRTLVPAGVADLIARHGLYRS
ncbi:MAG: nicotinate-nucleotide adenylyltransferase [bacterium]